MKLHKFSPIENKEQLLETVRYTHFKCFELCKEVFGRYLPAAGNIGIFCHHDDEYKLLTKIREELTEKSNNWNQKYFLLYEPIIIPAKNDIPETIYTYLYIRKPDQRKETGDADFVIEKKEFDKLKNSLSHGAKIKGLKIFDRPGLDLIELSNSQIDVLSFVGIKNMKENIS